MRCSIVRVIAMVAVIAALPVALVLAHDDDENEVKFTGTITSLPSTPGFIGDWTVAGRTVHVTNSTEIEHDDGVIAVGTRVEVEGRARADGSVDAQEIDVKGNDDDEDDDDDEDEFEFAGIVQTLPATAGFIGDWRVGGRTVHVTSATRIETEDGPIEVGAFVEVKGTQRADGSIDAKKIEVEENVVEIKGTIESLPGTTGFIGDWRVGGRTVHVGSATRIDLKDGAVVLGALVEVKGRLRADGSIDASRIEVESGGGNRANFKGTIQALPASLIGDWTISGRLVHVLSSTKLKSKGGVFAVGRSVKVKGISMPDGSTVATKIQIRK
jgi:cytoskeletal protein CcmA (bactofilin family)